METPAAQLPSPAARPVRTHERIGDVIVELGFASRERIEAAVEHARTLGHTTGRTLVDDGVLTPDQLARALAARFGLDHLDLSAIKVDVGAANLLDSVAARRYNAVPVAFVGERTLLVAMADPANVIAVDDIAIMTGYDVLPAVAAPDDVEVLIGRLSRFDDGTDLAEHEPDPEPETVELHESTDTAPVVRLVRSILAQAADRGASDVHFEPAGGELQVRFRIDGLTVDTATVPAKLAAGAIARIKIMAGLDIAERRVPQDGRVAVALDGRELDVRVVTLPLVDGEAAVLRLLGREGRDLKLEGIGLREEEQERVLRVLGRIHGAVLVTGPTGAGKTTTLYAALNEINTREKTITTIEDPVEYQLQGIKQIQVNLRKGMTFPTGLRSILRADPDVLMVGEIRDRETARTAIEAALTGHLVLSTLHTNDAASAIPHLLEMGTEPFLVASALECVIAQRLVRKLCDACKAPERLTAELLAQHGFPAEQDIDAFRPTGCGRCGGSGYRGRIGIFEVMILDDELRTLAVRRAPAEQIDARARAAGMRSLTQDGLDRVRSGATSIAELTRVAVG